MELVTKLMALEKRTTEHRELLLTEEAAKTALVLPFLQALGYDVFNPGEVIPEYTADVGIKKGEKVDYAICSGGKLNILIECKPSTVELDLKHASQLFRYFTVTDARVAILTNGVVYQFYSDTEQPNKMDEKPFYVFSMEAIKRSDPTILERFSKHGFNIDHIVEAAGRLKLQSQLRIELEKEFANPSDDLVRLMLSRVQAGRATAAAKEQFHGLLTSTIGEFIRDKVNDRLNSALNVANPSTGIIEENASDDMSEGSGIITTDDEISGFRIVQAIASRHVDPSRVVIRDSKSYCAILLDDNNRKSLARLHFNSPTTRYVGTFTEKEETRHPIGTLTDIYKIEKHIIDRILELEGGKAD
ncbi:type I restriction enzyme HsdR N-terminal domain-containing protein [Rhizorhabdus wittichii]|uniref:Type I restriction enzyme HsdR N-terminal domain-containing protein n=1 Tax=Rhizorhabdus wittichii TaxID=160791 RepID=A0A975CZ80_9SPHN|nr:type I restriction endonuclease [Rhizorhabdus wittichii]QTH20047.1 type I restriction enzyme HsdR N-terminal domain-containing protein [Rhizorhabdus wittichii]